MRLSLAGQQLGDIGAVARDEEHGHHRNRPGNPVEAVHQHVEERREHCRYQRRQRRVAKEHGDDEPSGQCRQPQPQVQREQNACRGRHALAARKAVKHRIQVAEEHGDHHQRDASLIHAKARCEQLCQPHREPAFGRITEQREDGRLLVARAQHIGGAGVAGAVGAGVCQTHRAADHHGKRDRADQVGGDGKNDGCDDWRHKNGVKSGCAIVAWPQACPSRRVRFNRGLHN